MADDEKGKVEEVKGTPLTAEMAAQFPAHLNITTTEQAAKVVTDAAQAVTKVSEEKDREISALQEQVDNQPIDEPVEEAPPAQTQGEVQDKPWGYTSEGRQRFVGDLQENPLAAVDSVAMLRVKQSEDRQAAQIEKLERRLNDKEVGDSWGDFTQQLSDTYTEEFVVKHKAELDKQMKRYGRKPPDMQLFRHFALLEKTERAKGVEAKPEAPEVEGASSTPSATGANKWVHPDGRPFTSKEMEAHLVASGELTPEEMTE